MKCRFGHKAARNMVNKDNKVMVAYFDFFLEISPETGAWDFLLIIIKKIQIYYKSTNFERSSI